MDKYLVAGTLCATLAFVLGISAASGPLWFSVNLGGISIDDRFVGSGLYCAGFSYDMFIYNNYNDSSCRDIGHTTLAPTMDKTSAPTPGGATAAPTFENKTVAPSVAPSVENITSAPSAQFMEQEPEQSSATTISMLRPCGSFHIPGQCYYWSDYISDLNAMNACADLPTAESLGSICKDKTAKIPSEIKSGRILGGLSTILTLVVSILGCCVAYDGGIAYENASASSLKPGTKLGVGLFLMTLSTILFFVCFAVVPHGDFTKPFSTVTMLLPLMSFEKVPVGFLPTTVSYGLSFGSMVAASILGLLSTACFAGSLIARRDRRLKRQKDSNMVFIYGEYSDEEPFLVRPEVVL